jgi:hypothetical protein
MASMAWFGNEGPPAIKEYRVDGEHWYHVKASSEKDKEPWAGTTTDVGIAKAGGAPGAFWVDFEISEPTYRFYSVWHVDKDGVANLSEILLAIGPYGGAR